MIGFVVWAAAYPWNLMKANVPGSNTTWIRIQMAMMRTPVVAAVRTVIMPYQ
jgi:hypothetical protein